MNCLFVDDDIDDQEIFSFALECLNKAAKIITAKDGVEALKIVHDNSTFSPDCIFLDLNMPRMGGKECLQELRKIPRLKEVPIFIYTTSSQEKDRLDTQKFGASDFISKEPSIELLKVALTKLFQRHRI
jgi:CheY-like chemotaxis protein